MENRNRNQANLRSLLAVVAVIVVAYAAMTYAHRATSPLYAASAGVTSASEKVPPGDQVATLSGGCFWAMQAMYSRIKGVDSVVAGYAGGSAPSPTYEEVCTESTGYAETVQVIYDPKVIGYRDLLTIFFHVINPTTKDQQGDDVGSSYRSVIFYHDAQQKQTADDVIADVNKSGLWPNPIVTELVPFTKFYRAEDYHQNYFAHNPDTSYCQFVVAPKVQHLRDLYAARLKPGS